MNIKQNPINIIFYIIKLFFVPIGRIGRLDFIFGTAITFLLTYYVVWQPFKRIPIPIKATALQSEGLTLQLDKIKALMANVSTPIGMIENGESYRFLLITAVILLWCTACLSIKRLHDMESKAWVLLLAIIPPINFIIAPFFLAGFLFSEGTKGPNRYGVPKKPFHFP